MDAANFKRLEDTLLHYSEHKEVEEGSMVAVKIFPSCLF
jgi:hypothetical protein